MSKIELIKKDHRILVNQISALKKNLDESNQQKEFWFNKKEALKKDISVLVAEIRSIKSTSDKSRIMIEDLKRERDRYNEYMKVLINRIHKLNKEKFDVFKKYKIKEDPYKIQKRIEGIESRLETETSFENEKKLMKKLKELKRIYEESKTKELIDKIDKLSGELEITKKKANDFHNRFKEALKGKDSNSHFIQLTRKINDFRSMQEDAFNKFIMHKKEFLKTNNLLKIRLKTLGKLKIKIDKYERKKLSKSQSKIKKLIKVKTRTVLDKIRKKKKLTTEDLLVLQGESK